MVRGLGVPAWGGRAWRLAAAMALLLGLLAGALGAPGRAGAAPPAGGRPYAWGRNDFGQLGDGGGNTHQSSPVGVFGLADAVAVAAGGNHSLALTAGGRVYAWGADDSGQLGDGGPIPGPDQPAPVPVIGLDGVTVVAVAAGGSHSLALTSTGQVYAWGADDSGQLGDGGTNTDKSAPVAVQGLAGVTIVAVAAGSSHSLALSSTGQAYAWGWDFYGQLGDGGPNTDQPIPVAVQQPAGVAFAAVAAGEGYSLALSSTGQAYTWGSDQFGQLGDGGPIPGTDQPTPVTVQQPAGVAFAAIAAGTLHIVAATSTGQVYAWGYDGNGQLGDGGTNTDQSRPVPVAGLGGVVAVAAGNSHSLALTAGGQAHAWGADDSGQLGDGGPIPGTDQPVPVAVALPAGLAAVALAGGGSHSLSVLAPRTATAASGAATAGGAATLTAVVTRQDTGEPVPAGGPVTFAYNGQTYTATTDAQGVARATAPLPAGTAAGTYPAAVQARYAGAVGYAPSQGTGPLTVAAGPAAPATPTTAVSVTGTATAGGATVALRAAVARQSDGAPVPAGGSVTFTYNGATYTASTDAQGVATATAPLPAGTQPGSYPGAVRASYAGTAGYPASQGEGPLNVATAACSARFADVQDTDPACPAIIALVNRGVIYGYATTPPTFGPLIQVQRAETAAFLVRALGWSERPQGPRSFSDLGPLEGTDLARAVRIVANACDSQGNCVAAGTGGGRFEPSKPVTRAEVVAFLTRAFKLDSKYAWADQPGAPNPYTGVPAVHDTAVRTYVYYAGGIPDAPTTADGWNAPASRAWVARVLYQALTTKP